mmetsp:Transcript_26887/g.57614  ORF Transcript_26887/g.57614 Transcript_26887/m.57614 type:complete len:169 (+) Transcript_26887:58-564(+)
MSNEDDSDDSDEWGTEELVIPPKGGSTDDNKNSENANGKDDEDYWKVEPPPVTKETDTAVKQQEKQKSQSQQDSRPMIIVDLTLINPNIHSRFDKNSVNSPEEASALRKTIENSYEEYARSGDLLSDGTVIPCGMSVWRDALVRLRNDRKGHYFVPIFPPQPSSKPNQ